MAEIVEHREGDAARLTAADPRRRGRTAVAVIEAETMGRKYGVQSTPV